MYRQTALAPFFVLVVYLGAAFAGPSSASGNELPSPGRSYGELYLGAGGVKVRDLDFYPLFAGLSAGAFVLPGIGVELFADASLADDEADGFQLEVERAYGAGVRFQSPSLEGLSGYIVLGYVEMSISQELDDAIDGDERRVEEDFTGVRASVGFVQRFDRIPWLSMSAEYRVYYVEDGLDLDAFLLGLRFGAR